MVVGSSCSLVSRLAGASPWGPVAGTVWKVHGRLTPAHSMASKDAGAIRPPFNMDVLGIVSVPGTETKTDTVPALLGLLVQQGKWASVF